MSTGPIFGEPHEVYHAHAAHGSHDLADLEPYPLLFFKAHVEKSIPARADTDALKHARRSAASRKGWRTRKAMAMAKARESHDRS